MKPNIIFLTIDSLRLDRIFTKNKSAMIPNIEKLIDSGIFFDHAISTSDATGLSLGSIFASMYPFKSGITHYKWNSKIHNCFDVLKENNYTLFSTVPDVSFFLKQTSKFDFNHHYTYDKRANWKQLTGGIGETIIDDLKSHEKFQPWFHLIHLMDLHGPFYLPLEFDKEEFGKTKYDRMISYIDTWIGKILQIVDSSNTILIISADHGDYIPLYENLNEIKIPSFLKKSKKFLPVNMTDRILDKIQTTKRSTKIKKLDKNLSSDQLRTLHERAGEFLFDELIRIPLIISGINLPNMKISNLVRQVDIFPTLFDLIQINNTLDSIDGRSLMPLIKNDSLNEEPAYIESGARTHRELGQVIGFRTSTHKYVRSRNSPKENVQLYDLKNDPDEKLNLALSNTKLVKEMETTLQKIRGELNEDLPDNYSDSETKEIENELRKLGYI
tara:strand:- start:55 stop:1380 length:1326 start_codon:yes stop_codon:yes gene_type:complete